MACGAPVITSNTTSLPEVAGDASLLINPHDQEEIRDALISVLHNTQLRETLREKGLKRAKTFSWDKTAAQVWDTLQNVYVELYP
jgi:glycosyltransferase involved in cell wall biosynthesis